MLEAGLTDEIYTARLIQNCCPPPVCAFGCVPAQGAKGDTFQTWEALPAHDVPTVGASAALSIQAKITEPDFSQVLCTSPPAL